MVINICTLKNIERYCNNKTINLIVTMNGRFTNDNEYKRLKLFEPSNILAKFIENNDYSGKAVEIFKSAYLSELNSMKGNAGILYITNLKGQVNIVCPSFNELNYADVILNFLESKGIPAVLSLQ